MHTRTAIVGNAQKRHHLSSSRPYGCWDKPAYRKSELRGVLTRQKLASLTFRTLKQIVQRGRPSCAKAPVNHAKHSTGASRHTSGPWLPFRAHCMGSPGGNGYPSTP